MRRLLGSLAIWSAVVVAIVLLWPGQVQTPGCASSVTPTADCLTQVKAMDDGIWWMSTVPLLVVIAAGYLVIVGLAWRSRRQHRR
jgi:heme/copper-type cytochrome/quinol oxidase subunit 2